MKIELLVERAKHIAMSNQEMNEQRRNFAFGSSNIENDRISRDTVTRAESELRNTATAAKNNG